MKTQVTAKRGKGPEAAKTGPGGNDPACGRDGARPSSAAYGEKVPICINTACVMRKQAGCFGFEGCPGFKAKG